jgi:hypothetical protein
LCWRLDRQPGQQRWIKTKDVVFSWGGIDLGVVKATGYRPASEDELDVVDWSVAWKDRVQSTAVGVQTVVDDVYGDDDELESWQQLKEVEEAIKNEDSVSGSPLDYSFAEAGDVFNVPPPPPMGGAHTPGAPDAVQLHTHAGVPEVEGDVIDLGGELHLAQGDDGEPVLRLEGDSVAMAAMTVNSSDDPMDWRTQDYAMIDISQLADTAAFAAVQGGDAIPVLSYSDLKLNKQEAKPLPKSVKEAVNMPGIEGLLWRKSLKTEQQNYKDNGVYTNVQRKHVPKGTRMFRFVTVVDRKYDPVTGALVKLKCRIALIGTRMDAPFEHKHAAVPRASSIRFMELMATEGSFFRWDSDTVAAFLQAEFQNNEEGTIFCVPPWHMQELDEDGNPYVWTLNRAVYGTVVASAAYVSTLEKWLFNQSPLPLKVCEADCKVYMLDVDKVLNDPKYVKLKERCEQVYPGWGERWLGVQQLDVVPPPSVLKAAGMAPVNVPGYDNYNRPHYFMTTHIDDMRHFSNMTWLHEDVFLPAFKKRFKITHCDKALNLAGVLPTEYLKLRWTHSTGEAKADNSLWIGKFLAEHGHADCKPQLSPMPESLKFDKDEMPTDATQERLIVKQLLAEKKIGPGSTWPAVTNYADVRSKCRSVVGGFGWVAQTSHPELQGAHSMWASQLAAPSYRAFISLQRGLRYAKKAKDDYLVYTRSGSTQMEFHAQSDASLGADSGSGSSQYGYWVAANGSAVIESKAGRTKMVCLSTTHTEIVSLSECIRALVALRRLAEECGFIMRTPSRVDCDNEVAIKLSKLRTNSDKSRTIRLRDFYCREAVSRGEVCVEFMKGTDIDADIFTKAKGDPAFAKMAKRLKQGHRGVL